MHGPNVLLLGRVQDLLDGELGDLVDVVRLFDRLEEVLGLVQDDLLLIAAYRLPERRER